MILRPLHLPRRHFHAEIVKESSAIVGLMGRSGTAECLLNGRLSNKLIFPIATVPGSARDEWEQAKRDLHKNREPGDLDFLADSGADPQTLVGTILDQCRRALHGETPPRPRKVFIAHGHSGLQNELARALTKLKFSPLILAEQPGVGRTVREMLLDAVKDVGFALVLYTPDDLGSLATERRWRPRARQNVVFEHGLLIGILGPTRVCAILLENGTDKRGFDIPSDILGERTLLLRHGSTVVETGMKIGPELRHAGYTVDLSLLTEP